MQQARRSRAQHFVEAALVRDRRLPADAVRRQAFRRQSAPATAAPRPGPAIGVPARARRAAAPGRRGCANRSAGPRGWCRTDRSRSPRRRRRAGLHVQPRQRQLVRPRVRLVVARLFRRHDHVPVHAQQRGGAMPQRPEQLVTTPSRLCGRSAASSSRAPSQAGSSPSSPPARQARKRAGRPPRRPRPLLIGQVGAAAIGAAQVLRAPRASLRLRTGGGVPDRPGIEQGGQQVEQHRLGKPFPASGRGWSGLAPVFVTDMEWTLRKTAEAITIRSRAPL